MFIRSKQGGIFTVPQALVRLRSSAQDSTMVGVRNVFSVVGAKSMFGIFESPMNIDKSPFGGRDDSAQTQCELWPVTQLERSIVWRNRLKSHPRNIRV